MSTQRYSEQRLNAPFEVFLLLRGPFNLSLQMLAREVASLYPSVNEWEDFQFGVGISSNEPVGLGMIPSPRQDGHSVNIIYTRGQRCPMDHYQSSIDRALTFPNAAKVMREHDNYISFSVKANGTDLASRFKAARAVNCITAAATKLLPCSGVLFPSGDIICSPTQWREAADKAVRREWPIMSWVSFAIQGARNSAGTPEYSCGSVGLAAFLGCEVSFCAAPVQPAEAATYVLGACHLMLERGNRFEDSDTIAVEGHAQSMRIRFAREGQFGIQTDTYFMLHPHSQINEQELFGDRTRPPAPPGVDNTNRGYDNYMSEILNKNQLKGFG